MGPEEGEEERIENILYLSRGTERNLLEELSPSVLRQVGRTGSFVTSLEEN